jgi:glycosyltransferase involved in cell wall biosynthesis
MKLSVVIPCFNEKNTINLILESVHKITFIDFEIIVIDDCSTDGTRDILEKIYNNTNLIDKLVLNKSNQGKGFSISEGIKIASGDLLIIQDADLEYNPQEIKNLLIPVFEHEADVVYGSRFRGGNAGRVLYFWHSVGNYILTLFSNIMTNLNLTDMETCYKLFKTSIIKNIIIKEKRFGFEPEITAKISKLDIKIFEVGISYNGRKYAQGKKINWKDGFRALYCIFRYNIFS